MPHPLVLALFQDREHATSAARTMRETGLDRSKLSIVARSHQEEGELAKLVGGSPGAEIEDSKLAAWLGELGGHILAAFALIVPGVGPIVAGGPLAAELGEAAGHVAGGLASMLQKAGLPQDQSRYWARSIERGAILLGVHVQAGEVDTIRTALEHAGATEAAVVTWKGAG